MSIRLTRSPTRSSSHTSWGREHWGQGLATEAARAIVDHAFQTLRPPRLICLFDPQNVASRRVAERVGFTYDRDVLLDGERVPMHSLRADR